MPNQRQAPAWLDAAATVGHDMIPLPEGMPLDELTVMLTERPWEANDYPRWVCRSCGATAVRVWQSSEGDAFDLTFCDERAQDGLGDLVPAFPGTFGTLTGVLADAITAAEARRLAA